MQKINPTFLNRDNLEGEWLLNGNPLDTSGNGNDGTASNMAWVSAERGYVGEVGSFNGSSSYINMSSNLIPSGSTRTFNVWVKPTDLAGNPGSQVLLYGDTGSVYAYGINILTTGSLNAFVYDGSNNIGRSAISLISAGEWQMITVVFQPNQKFKLYYNGTQLDNGTFVTDDTIPSSWRTAISYEIGRDSRDGDNEFYGDMGLVRMFDGVLTDTEIKSLYLEGLRDLGPTLLLPKGPLTSIRDDLEGEWPLNGDANDYSGNGNNGTPTSVTYDPVWAGEVGSFNGSTSKISGTGLSTTFTSYTFCAWVKATSTSGAYGIISQGRSSNGDWSFGINTFIGSYRFHHRVSIGTVVEVTASVPDTDWHFVAITWDGSNIEGFLDGVSQGTTAATSKVSAGDNFEIGKIPGIFNSLSGNLGMARKFNNKVLTDMEIKAIHLEGIRYIYPQRYSLKSLEDGKILSITRAVNSGTYYDQTGSGNDGAGSNVTDTISGLNNIMGFNGTSSYIQNTSTTDYNFSNDYSFALTIKTADTGNNNPFAVSLDQNGGQLSGYSIDVSGGIIRFRDQISLSTASILVGTTTISDNEYHRILCVKESNGNKKIYIDGYLDASNIVTHNSFYSTEGYYSIGCRINDGSREGYVTSDIANVEVCNRALTHQEAQQDFYSNFIS